MIDIDQVRDEQIQFHHLYHADRRYTFYHDETNNVRKLHVGAQGLNVAQLKVFVLGGVVHEGEPRPIDIDPLRELMQIQMTAPEIKLQHVAKGTFLEVLQTPKLTKFLRWMTDSGLIVHYQYLDPLYWSIVDIIDSILAGLGIPALYQHHVFLKSDLTAALRADLPTTVGLFYRYGYPGLAPEGRKPFLNEVIELVQRNRTNPSILNSNSLENVLQTGLSLESLDFIEGNPPNLLIGNFSAFYLNRIALFKFSSHILDMEDSIRDRLMERPITSGGVPATHYRFADSKSEAGIQLSDVIVGVLGKMHSYFADTPWDELAGVRAELTGPGLENAGLLRDLISNSQDANVAFLHHVASEHDHGKVDLFLRFHDGFYAE